MRICALLFLSLSVRLFVVRTYTVCRSSLDRDLDISLFFYGNGGTNRLFPRHRPITWSARLYSSTTSMADSVSQSLFVIPNLPDGLSIHLDDCSKWGSIDESMSLLKRRSIWIIPSKTLTAASLTSHLLSKWNPEGRNQPFVDLDHNGATRKKKKIIIAVPSARPGHCAIFFPRPISLALAGRWHSNGTGLIVTYQTILDWLEK